MDKTMKYKYKAEEVRKASTSVTPDAYVVSKAWGERNDHGEGDDLEFEEDVFPDVEEVLEHLPPGSEHLATFDDMDVFETGSGVVIVGYGLHGVWAQWVEEGV